MNVEKAQDISNKFLAIEIWMPFLIILGSFIFGYGKLSADVSSKVDKADQVVTAVKVEMIEEDVSAIRVKLDRHIREQNQASMQQAVLLQKILSKVEASE